MRVCCRCKRDIRREPGIASSNGLLCFPCRYWIDRHGGESYLSSYDAYLHQMSSFRKDMSFWRVMYGFNFTEMKRWRENAILWGLLFLLASGMSIMIAEENKGSTIPAMLIDITYLTFWISLVASIICTVLFFENRCPYPPETPIEPVRTNLVPQPKLIFDEELESIIDEQFVNYENGYPPDWLERRSICLERDTYKCRICQKEIDLNVHHVIPVSRGGRHSLQNLITLCRDCHSKQKYYGHDVLVRQSEMRRSRRHH